MHTKFTAARIRRDVAATSMALACATLIGACGSSSKTPSTLTGTTAGAPVPTAILNTHRIELAIENSVLRERHIHVKVTCPRVVPQQKGRNFSCLARIAHSGSTSKTPVAVTQQNNKGYVTFKVE